MNETLRIFVTEQDRQLVDVEINASQVLIGSDAHCDVRLGPDVVAPEQMRVIVYQGELYLEQLARGQQLTVGGVPFHRGKLGPDDEIRLGTLRIVVRRLVPLEDLNAKKGPSKIVLGGIGLVFLLLVVVAIGAGGKRKLDDTPAPPGSPFDALAGDSVVCPESQPGASAAAADELLLDADTRRERSPFYPKDGVKAVQLYRVAYACLNISQNREEALSAEKEARRLQERVEKDFHVHHVRLDRALTLDEIDQAYSEVRILKGYLTGQEGPYLAWLDDLERRLGVSRREN